MVVIDISAETHKDFVTWDGVEFGYEPKLTSQISQGDVCNVSIIHQGAHTGTHMDAPHHFVEHGKTIEELDLNVLVGPVEVVELYGRPVLSASDFEGLNLPTDTQRVLVKTDNTLRRLIHDSKFHRDYVGVGSDAAEWLVERGIKLIGVDYLSVGPYGDENIQTHRTLLGNDVVVIETLDLGHVNAGQYTLVAVPPCLKGLEGAPVRAILIQD
jgi:arylformamidase